MVHGLMVPNYIPFGRSDFFTPSYTWFCHITSGSLMVVWYDVIFIVEVEESSHSLQSSRELAQITKVSVQICTPQVRSMWNPDVFLSKF